MADRPVVVAIVVALWSCAGLAIALMLTRRGHEVGPWFALGIILGPLLVGLAVEATRHGESGAAIEVARGARGAGETAVVVAVLGDPARAADAAPVVRWLGPDLRELTLVRPVSFEAAIHDERDEVRRGALALSQAALFLPAPAPRLVLVPGPGAAAVARYASAVGAGVVVLVGDDGVRAMRDCARQLQGGTIVVGGLGDAGRSRWRR